MNPIFQKYNPSNQKKQTKSQTILCPKSIKAKSSPKLIKKKSRNYSKKYTWSEMNFTKFEQDTPEPFFQFPNDDENLNKNEEEYNEKKEEELERIVTSERSLTTETDENNFLFNKFQTTKIEDDENSEEESSQEIFSLIFHDHKGTKEEHKQQQFFQNEPQFKNPQKKKLSVPIPINHRLSAQFTSTNTNKNNSSESEEENPLENQFPLTFIEPHKYVDSIQTEIERELSKSFSVPLKRVPSWMI
ncbi:hypothetical protein M0813_19321 [Anaeramoeba flamelloides]|uniref:Uncharacterized protein n=1 Tax=Anaeramoeba flamelloides TaxID=1746091 RepID=A0ABQ8YP92_9EUKA|nr:hypothetical protein M0813_19321 [Anaeramoeba flamelloides]